MNNIFVSFPLIQLSKLPLTFHLIFYFYFLIPQSGLHAPKPFVSNFGHDFFFWSLFFLLTFLVERFPDLSKQDVDFFLNYIFLVLFDEVVLLFSVLNSALQFFYLFHLLDKLVNYFKVYFFFCFIFIAFFIGNRVINRNIN